MFSSCIVFSIRVVVWFVIRPLFCKQMIRDLTSCYMTIDLYIICFVHTFVQRILSICFTYHREDPTRLKYKPLQLDRKEQITFCEMMDMITPTN